MTLYIGERYREERTAAVGQFPKLQAHTWDLGFLGISEGMRKHKAIDASAAAAAPWEAQRR
jgi:hypothetical protein